MRLSRKSTLDLTPLLDVILIILFVFMMMLAQQVQQSTAQAAADNEKVDAAEESLSISENSLAKATEYINELEKSLEELEAISAITAQEQKKQKALMDEQTQTLDNATAALAMFMVATDSDIQKLLNDNKTQVSDKLLNEITSPALITKHLLKYEALRKQFYFIDIELKGKNNRVYINNSSTTLGISYDETKDTQTRTAKVKDIQNKIEDNLENRQGGANMVFITLSVYDANVYQYAWEIVWEAIGQVQEKYGTDKIYRTHITLIEN